MATLLVKIQCFSYQKETRTFLCRVCSKDFCTTCLIKHDQEVSNQLDGIGNDPNKRLLMKGIDRWEEEDTKKKIERKTNECPEK